MGLLGAPRDGSSVPHAHLLRQTGGTLGAANQVLHIHAFRLASAPVPMQQTVP